MTALVDLTGQRFGRWVVLRRAPSTKAGKAMWWCRCDCGTERAVHAFSLKAATTRSCGLCVRREEAYRDRESERRRTHGHASHLHGRSLTYKSWMATRTRCLWPSHPAYERYSALGVCDRWRDSFENFLSDVGERPSPEHDLHRIDNSRGYEPGNVEWLPEREHGRLHATPAEAARELRAGR
jgi:hypothetical protein